MKNALMLLMVAPPPSRVRRSRTEPAGARGTAPGSGTGAPGAAAGSVGAGAGVSISATTRSLTLARCFPPPPRRRRREGRSSPAGGNGPSGPPAPPFAGPAPPGEPVGRQRPRVLRVVHVAAVPARAVGEASPTLIVTPSF